MSISTSDRAALNGHSTNGHARQANTRPATAPSDHAGDVAADGAPSDRAQGGKPQSDRAQSATAPEPTPTLLQLGALIDGVTETARRAHEARVTGKARGAITGFAAIDREFCGALPNGLISINGGSGAGKTAFAFQVAASCGCPALFASCEMSPEELFRRHMARVNGHYLNRYKSGEMPPETVRAHAITAATAAPLLAVADLTRAISLPGQAPCKYLQDVATIMRRQHAAGATGADGSDHAPFLLVIDSLHSWAMGALATDRTLSALSETEILIHALGELNRLSHALRCPVLLITERNRANMDKGGINAGAGTRRIEYGAEAVLSLDVERDKNGEPIGENGAGEKNIALTFAKNRHGAAGRKVALQFNGALMRFREA